MEFFIFSTPIIHVTIFVSLLFLYRLAWIKGFFTRHSDVHKKPAPCIPGAWPIIGHLHLLGGSARPLHQILMSMAEKHGPIFTLKLGSHQALIVSDADLAKECYTTNDSVFASRPKSIAAEVMGYNYGTFGLAPYGPYWRQMRKVAIAGLLSHRRLQMLGNIRVTQVKLSMKQIFKTWERNKGQMVKMDMKQWIGSLTLNLIVTMIMGKRFSPDDEKVVRLEKSIRRFMELVGTFVVADAIPSLRWLDLGGYEKAMKVTSKEIDEMCQGWLDEHRKSRKNSPNKQEDFIDVILSLFEGESPQQPLPDGFDVDTIVKALCLTIIGGASDTTVVTLTWAVSLLLNNPQVLKKAQQEINEHVGRERQVEESDLKDFVYLHAILKETLRLYPAAPLLLPHESMDDCIVGGYNIPKGTRLLVNAYKIHRDARIWSNPYEFRPERFLASEKEIDVWGRNFELIPFGSGRRMCPGISFGLQSMHLTLASLIHGFELRNPSSEPIDMEEGLGLTILKATPLEVFLKPRLSPDLYV